MERIITMNAAQLATHPTIRATESIREIMRDFLQTHGLIHFSLVRIYQDGTHFCLTTHPEMTLDFHRLALYESNDFSRDLEGMDSRDLLWLGCHTTNRKLFQYAEEAHQLAHGLVCIESHPLFQEQCYYASTPSHPGANNFYLNNLEKIHEQNQHFRDAARDIIAMAELHRLTNCNPAQQQHPQRPVLSPREKQLLSLLAGGYSCKRVADSLGIKTKTVYYYLDNIKQKLLLWNRDALVEYYRHSGHQT